MATRGVNKVILVGNLGQNPEIRYFPDGGAIANLSLATSESWRDKNTGEQKEEGSLRTRKWTDQGGQDRYSTEVNVSQYGGVMQMLRGRSSQNSQQGEQNNPPLAQPAATPAAGQSMDFDDDIPF